MRRAPGVRRVRAEFETQGLAAVPEGQTAMPVGRRQGQGGQRAEPATSKQEPPV